MAAAFELNSPTDGGFSNKKLKSRNTTPDQTPQNQQYIGEEDIKSSDSEHL